MTRLNLKPYLTPKLPKNTRNIRTIIALSTKSLCPMLRRLHPGISLRSVALTMSTAKNQFTKNTSKISKDTWVVTRHIPKTCSTNYLTKTALSRWPQCHLTWQRSLKCTKSTRWQVSWEAGHNTKQIWKQSKYSEIMEVVRPFWTLILDSLVRLQKRHRPMYLWKILTLICYRSRRSGKIRTRVELGSVVVSIW